MTTPLNNLTDTWNNSGTVFTGLKYNITDTASDGASLLMDLQKGSVSQFNVDKFGNIFVLGGYISITANCYLRGYNFGGSVGNSIWSVNSLSAANFLTLGSGLAYPDIILSRDGAGLLGLRDSTNARTLRVYNTFTDASNYERGVFDWTTTSNVLTIGTQAAGTGTGRALKILTQSAITYSIAEILFASLSVTGGTKSLFTVDVLSLDYANSDTILARGAAGIFKFASSQSFSADGTVATVLGSLGPSGANTTVQEWLTIKNASGTTRYIPCF